MKNTCFVSYKHLKKTKQQKKTKTKTKIRIARCDINSNFSFKRTWVDTVRRKRTGEEERDSQPRPFPGWTLPQQRYGIAQPQRVLQPSVGSLDWAGNACWELSRALEAKMLHSRVENFTVRWNGSHKLTSCYLQSQCGQQEGLPECREQLPCTAHAKRTDCAISSGSSKNRGRFSKTKSEENMED